MTANQDWHRAAVGGRWDEIGKLQYDFLVAQGLAPEHFFLDVGCGSLRGGVHFVRYLCSGHYFGVDINQDLLDAGRVELERSHLTDKKVTLAKMSDFDFASLGRSFDYALAQSLFTHLPLNSIIVCMMNIEKVLTPGGSFYASFFENREGKFRLESRSHPSVEDMELVTHFDRDPYHYDFETFEWICEGTMLKASYIGDWNHPRDQMMLLFTKTRDTTGKSDYYRAGGKRAK